MTDQPQPTDKDRENFARRRVIATRQQAQLDQAARLARTLGVGWVPSMKLSLFLAGDCNKPTGPDDPAPVPVTVAYRVGRWVMGEHLVRFVRELPDGQVLASERYDDVFQGMLEEKDPERRMEIRGQKVPCKRFQLYWSSLDVMEPRTAEELAALRASREQGKARRAEKKWAADNPLLAWAERQSPEDEKAGGHSGP
jgi:hypothetical protein